MSPTMLERRGDEWLDRHVHDWVDAGLITDEQAGLIRGFERGPVEVRRFTLGAEIATYLGGVIAFAGGAAVIGPNWSRLGIWGQLALGLAIAVAGFVVGTWSVHVGEAGTERLGWFLWLVGTGGAALMVGAAINEIDPRDEAWFGVTIGATVLVSSVALWRNLDRPLQLLSSGVGAMILGAGLQQLFDVSVWVASPVLYGVSVLVGVLAAVGRLHPRLVALAMAAMGAMIGAFSFAGESEEVASIVAVATAAGVVIFAMVDRSLPLLVIGVAEFFIGTTSLMQAVLHGMAARLVAVLIGLAVVALAAMRAQRMGRAGPASSG